MIPDKAALQRLLAEAERSHPIAPTELAWLAGLIDHTLLKPGSSEEQHRQLCAEARRHGFATVCVRPEFVRFCAEELRGSPVLPITVVGFPSGGESTEEKVRETREAIANGAREIDMVLAVQRLKGGQVDAAFADIQAVVRAAGGIPVKVILETCLLNDDQKRLACQLAVRAGAAFVKTSTGFSTGGATAEDIALMREAVGDKLGVKASGGVRSLSDALKMVLAGANRIGTSSGVSLVAGNLPASGSGVY
jgi:deoxyribose-phosphate aldolase